METIIEMSESAQGKLKELLGERDDLMLRVGVQPGGCSGLMYELFFDERTLEGDFIQEFENGTRLVVDKTSSLYLKGSTLDYQESLMGQGFTLDNPNAQGSCACGGSFH